MSIDFQSNVSLSQKLPIAHELITRTARDKQFKAALEDLYLSIKKAHIWLMLGYDDIRLRYRRSILGPFWITLSMAITVYSMGFLYARLFHNDLASYFPFLTAGMLAWALVSSSILELSDGFTQSENLIKQIKLPFSLFIHRIVWRNILIFLHNLIVIVPIILIFHHTAKINFYSLLLIPNMFLFYINAFSFGMVLAMIGSRYRDLSQMIKSLVQIAFFMTPIMWDPKLLPERFQAINIYNPFYEFVELLREPLIGKSISMMQYAVITAFTLIGLYLMLSMLTKYRSRIVFWV